MMLASIGPKKKGTPEGTFLCCWELGYDQPYDQPRQEPGRNFGFKVVPSAVLFPQRQPKTVFPPTSAEVIGTGLAPAPADFSGTRVTNVPLIPVVAAKPCIVTVTLPLMSVAMVDTYFEAPPGTVASQPQL